MIPQAAVPDFTAAELPSKTWKIDFEHNRISGTLDGADAVAQAAMLALQTPRYKHLIYSWQYGSELHTLIGKDEDYVLSEAKRMMKDALSTDPHITAIKDFTVKGKVLSFTLETIYGSRKLETEVMTSDL